MGWERGDLALCVKLGQWMQTNLSLPDQACVGPMPGAVLLVVRVCPAPVTDGTNLFFAEFPNFTDGEGYAATRFVKITPGAKIEGVEERRRLPVREDA